MKKEVEFCYILNAFVVSYNNENATTCMHADCKLAGNWHQVPYKENDDDVVVD